MCIMTSGTATKPTPHVDRTIILPIGQEAYIEQILSPTLKKDDIVVIDNLSSHKVVGVKEAAMESVGTRLVYLPPYTSPEQRRIRSNREV